MSQSIGSSSFHPFIRPDLFVSSDTQPIGERASIGEHAKEILTVFRDACSNTADPRVDNLLKSYQSSLGGIFRGADFLVRHGAMHASHVSLMVPIMVNFYKYAGDPRICEITETKILGMQIMALFHDYGRAVKVCDLTDDTHEMELIGAEACFNHLGFTRFELEFCEQCRKAILEKDCIKQDSSSFPDKDIYCEILQVCDSMAVLRDNELAFDPKYLDVYHRIEFWDPSKKEQYFEILYEIIDSTKEYLIALGDSPRGLNPLSKLFQKKGYMKKRFSLEEKRGLERAPDCFDLMQTKFLGYPLLKRWYRGLDE